MLTDFPSQHNWLPFLFALALLTAALYGCGSEQDADLGDWTLEEERLTLTDTLRVSETEAFYFGSVTDLDVTSDGRMVVLDSDAQHLKVLRSDGTLIDTLGRQGRGPGEFRRPRTVDVARGDSVYVFDILGDRLTVFTPLPSAEVARSLPITSDRGSVTEVRVLEDGLAGRFSPGYSRKEGFRRPAPAAWRVVHETGVPGDTLLRAQRRKVATFFEGQGAAIAYLPFGRVTRAAAGPDAHLYHGYTDSLHIHVTSLDGITEAIATVPSDPVRVTEAERDSVLQEYGGKLRPLLQSALPETKPAFTDLLVADDGQLWVERPAKGPNAETVPWWVLDPETKTTREVRLPSKVDLEVVQNGKVYGTTETEAGAPAVVRYRVSGN